MTCNVAKDGGYGGSVRRPLQQGWDTNAFRYSVFNKEEEVYNSRKEIQFQGGGASRCSNDPKPPRVQQDTSKEGGRCSPSEGEGFHVPSRRLELHIPKFRSSKRLRPPKRCLSSSHTNEKELSKSKTRSPSRYGDPSRRPTSKGVPLQNFQQARTRDDDYGNASRESRTSPYKHGLGPVYLLCVTCVRWSCVAV